MIIELLKDLLLIQYAFIQNWLIESMIKNLRELLENQIDQENYDKESSWIASRSMLKSCLDHSIKETQDWYVCIVL